jgi:hypothetical protein
MSVPPTGKSLGGGESVTPDLPTRQKNALRLLLGKSAITPEEVARLDYRVIERAPGVGKNSLAIIRAWLNGHGFELKGLPDPVPNQRRLQRQRKLEQAIDYVRDHGYEVLRTR